MAVSQPTLDVRNLRYSRGTVQFSLSKALTSPGCGTGSTWAPSNWPLMEDTTGPRDAVKYQLDRSRHSLEKSPAASASASASATAASSDHDAFFAQPRPAVVIPIGQLCVSSNPSLAAPCESTGYVVAVHAMRWRLGHSTTRLFGSSTTMTSDEQCHASKRNLSIG